MRSRHFSKQQNLNSLFLFKAVSFVSRLAYLVHIIRALNQLNLQMQGKGKDIILFVDFTNTFVEKLSNRKHKVEKSNPVMSRMFV